MRLYLLLIFVVVDCGFFSIHFHECYILFWIPFIILSNEFLHVKRNLNVTEQRKNEEENPFGVKQIDLL